MAYGETQINNWGERTGYLRRDAVDPNSGGQPQVDLKFDNMASLPEEEADAFFQTVLDKLAEIPGVTVAGRKNLNAYQDITPDVAPA